jgi:hypothetical protein
MSSRNRRPLSLSARFAVLQRDNFTCRYCGGHPPDVRLEVDHRVPVCRGGTNAQSNLVTACFACNRGKHTKELRTTKYDWDFGGHEDYVDPPETTKQYMERIRLEEDYENWMESVRETVEMEAGR